MQTLRTMLAAPMLAAVIVGAACVQTGADPADDIMAAVRSYAKAYEVGDAAGALAFYSERDRNLLLARIERSTGLKLQIGVQTCSPLVRSMSHCGISPAVR
jgi:hypothetical protein